MRRIVFAGAGHASIFILRDFARKPVDAELVLVNDGPYAWYTGALPALIRGDILPEQARIDVAALAASCGATFINARYDGFENNSVNLAGHPAHGFDFLVLSVGGKKIPGGVKPIPALLERLQRLDKMPKPKIGIIGAGAAGVELALALQIRLGARAKIHLCGREILPHAPKRAQFAASAALQKAAITFAETLPDGLDDIIHAYTPEPDLPVRATLQLTGHETIFAAGDCAKFSTPLPRSGAIAVRQGKYLAANLRRLLKNETMLDFKTPRASLAIMSLDAKTALAWYDGLSWHGRLPMLLKTWLDQNWLASDRPHRRP